MYVSSTLHDVPTNRENRFQRFSNSGTYRVTHRSIVECATCTPRSAIISTRSRLRQPIRDVPAHAQLEDVGVEGPLAVNRVTGYRLRHSAPLQGQRILLDAPECTRTRYRQTLADISNEKSSIIVFPLPLDLITPLLRPTRHD